jgi:hypothetical protein
MSSSLHLVSRAVAVTLVAALLLVGLPAGEGHAAPPPETRGAQLDGLSPELPDGAGQATLRGGVQRSEPVAAPIPFTGVGFAGDGDEPEGLRYRALLGDGTWSDWQEVDLLEAFDGPDADTAEAEAAVARTGRWTSEAVWVGEGSHLQVEVAGGDLEEVDVTVIDAGGLSESRMARLGRQLRAVASPPPAEASTAGPPIVTRAQWHANESWRKGSPSYATPKFAVLHHTASTNDYTRTEAPQQVRNIYYWHTHGNGWSDIGYNFLVDKFGTIYEGRAGGMDRGVVGAHAFNWNSGSFGVALMGNYNSATPGSAALRSLSDLIAWKFDTHFIDPATSARAWHNSQSIPTLVGHRNVRGSYVANPSTTTDCPGQTLYLRMDTLRQQITSSTYNRGPWTPLVGDWNNDGRTTAGWFRDGVWRLRNSNSAGTANLTFGFGMAGDLPVVGDWNGDGRTTVGIVRDGQWHLRNANSSGPADHVFWYGRGAIDYPMAGDWNGNGRDTPAIVRDGEWHLRNSLSGGRGEIVFVYGRITRGDVPVVGDWNGNGRSTPGILRDGEWHLRNSLSGGSGDWTFVYGRVTRGDVPFVGDWNRDGRTTVGVTRGGDWHLRNSLSGGTADISFTYR